MVKRGEKRKRASQTRRQAARRAQREQEPAAQARDAESSWVAVTGFGRKVARAEAHIDGIDTMLAAWRGNGYRISKDTDGDGVTTEYAQLTRPLPEDVPLLIGDACQCLLNALDHLAFAIASTHPDGLTEAEEEKSAFPIRRNAARNDRDVITPDARVTKWPPCAIAIVALMQPYLGELGKEGLDTHPLWLLRDLANRDKHRELHIVALGQAVRELAFGGPGSDNTYVHHFETFGWHEIGAEPVPLVAYGRRNYGDIRFRREFALRFASGPLVQGREVVPTLRWLAAYVRDIPIKRLTKFAVASLL